MAIALMMFAAGGYAGKAEAGGRFLNGSKLLGWCESDSLDDQGACFGYIAGLFDITGTYEGSGLLDPMHCLDPQLAQSRYGQHRLEMSQGFL